MSEQESRSKALDLTEEEASFLSKAERFGCHRESAKEMLVDMGNRQKVGAQNLVVRGRTTQFSLLKNRFAVLGTGCSHDRSRVKKYSDVEPGRGILRCGPRPGLNKMVGGEISSEVGEAHEFPMQSNDVMGLNQAQINSKIRPMLIEVNFGNGLLLNDFYSGPGLNRSKLGDGQLSKDIINGLGQIRSELFNYKSGPISKSNPPRLDSTEVSIKGGNFLGQLRTKSDTLRPSKGDLAVGEVAIKGGNLSGHLPKSNFVFCSDFSNSPVSGEQRIIWLKGLSLLKRWRPTI